MSNLWAQFQALLNPAPLLIGTIETVRPDGLAVVILPDGGHIIARGTGIAGAKVYVQNGVIQGDAPAMPVDTVTVY